jgi:PAS domain-containing protein
VAHGSLFPEDDMEDELTLRQIVDGLSALIATVTPDGQVNLVNRLVLDYLGTSHGNLREWQTSGAVHPDDLSRVITAWRLSLDPGEPYELDQRIRRADRIYRLAQVRGLPLR